MRWQETSGIRFRQRLLDQRSVSGIVFNQQHPDGSLSISIRYPFGSLTIVSQKPSMAFTTSKNWSRPRGLVM